LTKSLGILESTAKGLGYDTKWVQEKFGNESVCEIFAKLIITTPTPYEQVKEKMMSLVQVWAFMFKNPSKYCALEVSFVIMLEKIAHSAARIFWILTHT
jgi:hypothetical protein